MRILELDLRAFANFTHKKISFDPQKKIHVILDSNEAGKSSFVRALEAVMFGFEKNSKDNYLHPETHFYLEGLFENNSGKIQRVIRTSKRTRGETSKIFDLYPELSRSTFQNIFCLNQDRVYMGAKDLVENIQQFDFTFFSSFKGITGILPLLKSMEKDLDSLYKPRGKKPIINQKISNIDDILKRQLDAQTSYESWMDLQKEKESINKQLKKKKKELSDLSGRLQEFQSLYESYDLITEYRDYTKKLESFKNEIILDKKALNEIKSLDFEIKETNSFLNQFKQRLAETDSKIKNIKVDENILALQVDFEILKNEVSEYEGLINKKKKLENEVKTLKNEYKHLNGSLQEKIDTSLSLSDWKKIRDKFYSFLNEMTTLLSLKDEKSKVLNNYRQKIQEKENLIQGLDTKNILELETNLKVLDEAITLKERMAVLKSEMDQVLTKLNDNTVVKRAIKLEDFYSSEIKNLCALDLDEIKNLKIDYLDELKLVHQKQNNKIKLEGLKSTSHDLELKEFFSLKKKRNKLRTDLLLPWNAQNVTEKYQLFKTYQDLLDQEDIKVEFLFAEIHNLAIAKSNEIELFEIETFLDQRKKILLEKQGQLKQLSKPFINFLSDIDFLNIQDVEGFFVFFDVFLNFQQLYLEFGEIGQAFGLKLKSIKLNQEENLFSYRKEFSSILDFQRKNFSEKEKLVHEKNILQKSVAEFQNDLEKSNVKLDLILENWKNFSEKNKISFLPKTSNASEVIRKLDHFFDLSKNINIKNEQLTETVKQIEKYKQNVTRLRNKFGFTDLTENNFKLYMKKVELEIEKKKEFDELNFSRKNILQDIDKKKDKFSHLEKNKHLLIKKLKLDPAISIDDLILTSLKFWDIEEAVCALEKALKLKCKPKSIKFYLDLCSKILTKEKVQDAIQFNAESLNIINEEIDSLQKNFGELNFREKQAYDFSNKVQLDQNLQEEIYQINEKCEQYLVTQISKKIIQKLIRNFQNENQHVVLNKAQNYFNQMTSGKYSKVKMNLLNQKESFLLCQNEFGQDVSVDSLSEGARDQLFISLKLAICEIYCSEKSHIPIVLDDVFVNFDDRRVIDALNVLNEVSKKHQIIFLTHHKHVVDLMKVHLPVQSTEYLSLETSSKLPI